jgi:hypothetical protein
VCLVRDIGALSSLSFSLSHSLFLGLHQGTAFFYHKVSAMMFFCLAKVHSNGAKQPRAGTSKTMIQNTLFYLLSLIYLKYFVTVTESCLNTEDEVQKGG